jgi:2,4-dienoyl-CoA reductase-like NADH-dependent reductase (Old Yellow Enzyme family)
MENDPIFQPLKFRNLEVKNRIFRSNISGRFDNYNGSGTPARLNWEERFARGGVGAILTAHTPVSVRGRVLTNYAMIDSDERIPFFREMARVVHRHDCRLIMQLSHAGRQQDGRGVENEGLPSLTSSPGVDYFNGFSGRAMTPEEIRAVVRQFAEGAGRARRAGVDGVELHGNAGYLITQFLSPAINRRRDEYGGSLRNRARFLLEIVEAIRAEVGRDFHLQVKLTAEDFNNMVAFWEGPGTRLADSIQVCRWLEEAGVDGLHVHDGNSFPHPLQPPGPLPADVAAQTYGVMVNAGKHTFRNYVFFRYRLLRPLFSWLWDRKRPRDVEGINAPHAKAIRAQVKIPVLCSGGFQRASLIRRVLTDGTCDAVSIARPLIANPDLPQLLAAGKELPDRPCTFCNQCLVRVLRDPLGCYELSRFDGDRDAMLKQVMSVFEDRTFVHLGADIPIAAAPEAAEAAAGD